jgi:hypothetical protein
LTQAEVDAAQRGGLAMQQQCLELLQGNYSKAERLIDSATSGAFALTDALKRDPDTYYQPSGQRQPTTMRQLAGIVLDTLSRPDCDGPLWELLNRSLRDLPR